MDAGDTHGRPVELSPDAYPTRSGEEFDPQQLQTPATLNRTRLAGLPGAQPHWIGRRAFDLLSLNVLRQVRADEAPEVAGRRLGHLIATLRQGARLETESSAWRRAYLEYWSSVEEV